MEAAHAGLPQTISAGIAMGAESMAPAQTQQPRYQANPIPIYSKGRKLVAQKATSFVHFTCINTCNANCLIDLRHAMVLAMV